MFLLVAVITMLLAILLMPTPRYKTIKISRILLSITFVCISIICIISTVKIFAGITEREEIISSQEIKAVYTLVPFHFDDSMQGPENNNHEKKYYGAVTSDNWYIFYSEEKQDDISVISPKVIHADSVSLSNTFESVPSITEIFITYEFNMTKLEKLWLGPILPAKTWTATKYEISIPTNSIIENYEIR